MPFKTFSLFSDIRYYLKLHQELHLHLSKHPDDWSKFQQMFTLTVNKIYDDILNIEKENIDEFEAEVYRGKRIFQKRYRRYFVYGDFIKWSLEKPYGYAGDFKIIDDIYCNEPHTDGFDRLWDNYFQQLAAPIAIRERKEDFKKFIVNFIEQKQKKDIRIMNLASGSAREINEILENDKEGTFFSKTIFDCYDFDINAINYAKQILNNKNIVNFFQKNAIRLALKKDIKDEIPFDYDLIYSTGLFDYLDTKIAMRLLANLRKLLKKGGLMAISAAAEKYNNSSAGWMEWVADWYLIYRTENELRNIFIDAGFSPENVQTKLQNSKVMQYCFVKNPKD